MSGKKYLFFIDVDKTLIPTGETEIPVEIVSEIVRLKKLGHIFVISTGRSLNSTLEIKGIEVFQYISALLGNLNFQTTNQKVLNKPNYMPTKEIEKLVELLNEYNFEWSYKDERDEKTIFTESAFFKFEEKCKFVSINEFYEDLANNKIIQFLFVSHLPEEETKKFPNFNFFKMKGYTDVSLKDATKSRCVEFFKNKFPNMTTVSIGDSENDVPMFEKTDISIAMGNSSEVIKEKTTFVTKDILDNGLIYAFRNILKI